MNLASIDVAPMTEHADLKEQVIDDIAEALSHQGFILLQSFLPEYLAEKLFLEAKNLAAIEFTPAGIGRETSLHINTQVRTDSTLWLSGNSAPQKAYVEWMEQLRMGLNRRLFMGLNNFECHYSHYSKGDFYQRHLDAFKGHTSAARSNRVLSTVFYLNPNWVKNDGGELVLFADEQVTPLLTVPPIFNNCMLFLSDTFPHEVLISNRDRYSIAGWYRS